MRASRGEACRSNLQRRTWLSEPLLIAFFIHKAHLYAEKHTHLQLSLQGLAARDASLPLCSHGFISWSPCAFTQPSENDQGSVRAKGLSVEPAASHRSEKTPGDPRERAAAPEAHSTPQTLLLHPSHQLYT